MNLSCLRSFPSLFLALVASSLPPAARAAAPPETAATAAYTRRADVIYGRKDGMALTLDVLSPKTNANGVGIIWVISAAWVSDHSAIDPTHPASPVNELIKRGYTVIAVVHGSQPRYTVPEILKDLNRAVRFIRLHAAEYGIDPNRIGIEGASAGGHLSLMQGTAGDPGDPKAEDPVERVSSRVQAVACFFPPTDFLNFGKPGQFVLDYPVLRELHAPFTFEELDKTLSKLGTYVPITNQARIREICREISPLNHVSADDPPTLIIHGDIDPIVPIQQSEVIAARFKEVGVPAKLVVKPGWFHTPQLAQDMPTIADWFDKYLLKK
jgi:acetyl esterase/lipase